MTLLIECPFPSSLSQNPKVATLNFERNEVDRQFSNFHRFTPIGTEFDCSYPRPTPTFAVEAVKHTQLHLQAESCWAHPEKCISRFSPDGSLRMSGGCLIVSECV